MTASISDTLLAWYDRHARDLPWRLPPGSALPDDPAWPYRVWLSEVMLQQTTVAAVRGYFREFTERWPNVAALAAAQDSEVMAAWAGLGYYARARNLLACARTVVRDHGGRFPSTLGGLRTLPGVGPYTAAAIAAIAFDEPATVVDGNVERVVSRLFAIEDPLPAAKGRIAEETSRLTPKLRPGDFAQAMMDLGATVCTPRNPDCALCPLIQTCEARALGIEWTLPRKLPKATKPRRRGVAYVVRRHDGAVLLETRPPRGLLGGMLGFPGTDWADAPSAVPPLSADWRRAPVTVRHVFTHFELRLDVDVACVPDGTAADRGGFVAEAAFRPAALPTLMRKVWDAASPLLAGN